MISNKKQLHIINGPNLNLVGKREPEIYGSTAFEEFLDKLRADFNEHDIHYFQSNHEGKLIDYIHEVGFGCDGLIINAGALTHTSVALADALRSVPSPAVEVHMSNVHQREALRHHSYLSAASVGVVVGFGLHSYRMALYYFTQATT